jgi:hypothetical protein
MGAVLLYSLASAHPASARPKPIALRDTTAASFNIPCFRPGPRGLVQARCPSHVGRVRNKPKRYVNPTTIGEASRGAIAAVAVPVPWLQIRVLR